MIPLGKRVIRWRADKVGEFTGDEFKAYCLELDITHEFAATNRPQQIGVSERVGRPLCGMVRCMLVDGGLFSSIRGDCMMTASYLCNWVPHSAIKMETPYKMHYGKDTDLSHLRIIGARACFSPRTQRTQQAWSHVVGRDDVRPQPEWAQLIRYLEPEDVSSCRR